MPDVGQWPEYGDKRKDSRKHLLAWTPVKEHHGGTRSISFFLCTPRQVCIVWKGMNTEWVLGVHIAGKRTGYMFLSMACEGTVRSQNCKEGALKWAQT